MYRLSLLYIVVIQVPFSQLGFSGGATPGRARSNDLTGRSTALAQALAPPCLALPYCFSSVIVWTENKTVTISDRFICFILPFKRRWRPTEESRQLFFRKKYSRVICWRIFWPRKDLAPLLRWRRHC